MGWGEEPKGLTYVLDKMGTRGKGLSSSPFSFLQPVSEQAQQKLPPPALFKLDNQVQSGGAGEE